MLTSVYPPEVDRTLRNLPRICVALSGEAMVERATALLPECGFFECRLDTASDPAAALARLETFLGAHPDVLCIATCRRTENGGHFRGSVRDEARLLHAAATAGAAIVDLSIETAEMLQASAPEELNILRHSPATLLVSWHDFTGTPDLDAVHARIARVGPDLLKIVPTATSLDDALRVIDLLEHHGHEGNLIAMAMGPAGVLTRVLGPRSGSVFTFAAPDAEGATAPGQVDLQTLREIYRLETITAATDVYGVFGNPIRSSKSPVMLSAAFAATGVDAVYLPLETADAGALFRAMEALNLRGASVTMPLKEQILPSLQGHLAPLAATIGAANTLVRQADGSLEGHNTDAAGVADPLARRVPLKDARALVLGAGGAARAAVFALRARGAQVAILNRSASRAEALAADAAATAVTRDEAGDRHFDIVVNATPNGMPHQQGQALLPADAMHTKIFFDLVYNPLETATLQAARAAGIEVIPGLEMFVAQGAAQFTLWTGLPAPDSTMRAAVLRSLAS